MGGLLLSPWAALAASALEKKPPEVEDSTREVDKAAARDASADADRWAPSAKTDKPIEEPEIEASTTTTKEVDPIPHQETAPPVSPAEQPAKATPKPAPKTGVLTPMTQRLRLNEVRGKLLSKSYDPRTLRLVVEGGFNIELTYDPSSLIVDNGKAIGIDELGYNDELIVRYVGKELYAAQIERVSKAARPE